jgi:hypothetical protein
LDESGESGGSSKSTDSGVRAESGDSCKTGDFGQSCYFVNLAKLVNLLILVI